MAGAKDHNNDAVWSVLEFHSQASRNQNNVLILRRITGVAGSGAPFGPLVAVNLCAGVGVKQIGWAE